MDMQEMTKRAIDAMRNDRGDRIANCLEQLVTETPPTSEEHLAAMIDEAIQAHNSTYLQASLKSLGQPTQSR